MKKRKQGRDVWVVRTHGGYRAKLAGEQEALTPVTTQRAAIAVARDVARMNKSELIVQGRKGRIRIKDSYGRDAFPPRG